MFSVWSNFHCMKKRIFVLRKFVNRTEKIIFLSVFVYFRFTFHGNIIFYELPFKQKCKKVAFSANAYPCVNIKFSFTTAERKDENLCRILTKRSDFLLAFRPTFL